jgi:threonine aldolase
MRAAMAAAPVGDDFYREDPTVAELERTAADRLGKESGLFVPSGTMGNLLAHMTHCPGGGEVIGPSGAHSFASETGGPSRIAGMTVRGFEQHGGELDLDRIASLIRTDTCGVLSQPTGLLWVEQPTRGHVVPVTELAGLRSIADAAGLPIHMDGARIFNAAVALGVPAAAIAAQADSVMFCFSKGLGAPVGSMLVGAARFIERARRNRQMLGGGLRQAGILAAGALFALSNNVDRLSDDHARARDLADGLQALPGLRLDRPIVETNIFMIQSERRDLPVQELAAGLRARGVLVNVPGPGRATLRLVTHLGIDANDVQSALDVARALTGAPGPARDGTAVPA